jgi:bifunctional UDP-N-acetylglucosamine pyrophosphorylase/glucosamine-1-phosphate N-acetyltransferase
MKSDLPKVLHSGAGKALVEHVLDAVAPLGGAVGVVLGRGAEAVKERLESAIGIVFFVQKERRGSGDAVRPAARWLARRGGDVLGPVWGCAAGSSGLFTGVDAASPSREKCRDSFNGASCPSPTGYGRIRRIDGGPRPSSRNGTPRRRNGSIREINSGTYCFRVKDLLEGLRRLRPDNAKGEYYITDVIRIFGASGSERWGRCVCRTEMRFWV